MRWAEREIMKERDNRAGDPVVFRLGKALRPYVNKQHFRDAMASFGTTVGLVTARRGERSIGRTVTSVLSLSVDPPSILVSIDNASELAEAIRDTSGFSFAMLADNQQNVAAAFAGQGEPERRFKNGHWTSWPSGNPRLAHAVVAMDCELIGTIETRTHMLFAGGVTGIGINQDRLPLVWHQREYKSLAEPSGIVQNMSFLAEQG